MYDLLFDSNPEVAPILDMVNQNPQGRPLTLAKAVHAYCHVSADSTRRFFQEETLILAFLAAAATTPLGMQLSHVDISSDQLGILLSLFAGVIVNVGATHLLPSAE